MKIIRVRIWHIVRILKSRGCGVGLATAAALCGAQCVGREVVPRPRRADDRHAAARRR